MVCRHAATILPQRRRAFLQPLRAEDGKRLRFHHALGHWKHDAFLLVEVFARRGDCAEQDRFGVLERPGLVDVGQRFVNLPVLLVKGFVLPDLLEAMLQRPDEQVVLRLRVRREQPLDRSSVV